MKHLRILEKGFDKLTGFAGNIEFVDGLSVEAMTDAQASHMCGVMRCEMEDGTNPSIAGLLVANKETAAPVVEEVLKEVVAPVEIAKPATIAPGFTRASLEKIADKDGIAGIRDIATPLNLKSKSVSELINAILNASAKAK